MGKKVRRLSTENSTFVPKAKHIVINWGNSNHYPRLDVVGQYFNTSDAVKLASNKLHTFERLVESEGVNIPEFTDDGNYANDVWLGEGHVVVARTKLSGHSGEGIEIYDPSKLTLSEDGVNFNGFNYKAPLYTKYVKKKKEFRVHVAFGNVIDIQQKKKRSDFEGDPDPLVRNHHNGWVYCREGIVAPTDLENQAKLAITALGLDFGAVDIIYNERQNKCYVLEVNTAPGLEGTTVEKYRDAFLGKLNER